MAGQADHVGLDGRADPEGRAAAIVEGPAQRGDPHEERRAAQPIALDGAGTGGRGVRVEVVGQRGGQAGRQQRVPRHRLEDLAGRASCGSA